jgi:hypothetical protein
MRVISRPGDGIIGRRERASQRRDADRAGVSAFHHQLLGPFSSLYKH